MKKHTRITELRLENFTAYREKVSLPFSDFTVLLGYNASGKTSAITGLHILSLLARGRQLDSLDRETGALDFKSSHIYLPYLGKDSFSIGCSIKLDDLGLEIDIKPLNSNK